MKKGRLMGALILAGLMQGSSVRAEQSPEDQARGAESGFGSGFIPPKMDIGLDFRVRKTIADQLGIAVERVTPQSHLSNDLGLDSLGAVELLMTLEEQFGIKISDEQARELDTVGKVIAYVQAQRESKP